MKSITIKWNTENDRTDSMEVYLEGQPSPVEVIGILTIALQARVLDTFRFNQINNPNAASNLDQTLGE